MAVLTTKGFADLHALREQPVSHGSYQADHGDTPQSHHGLWYFRDSEDLTLPPFQP